jgi:integrase
MARRIRDKDIETRAARSKLRPSGKPVFRAIGRGLHLGYRKNRLEGRWVVRRYAGEQSYITDTIGTADDIIEADGIHVLNFWQAQERARTAGAAMVYVGSVRVADVFQDYLSHLGDRAEDTGRRVRNHVLPALGDLHVDELSADKIRHWLNGMVKAGDPEAIRKSKCSANRTLTILKAGLNLAFRHGKVSSDSAWRRVEPFRQVARSRTRYLSMAEVERFLNACTPDFRRLARGALETGARYGELQRLTVGDFNVDAGSIHVRKSKIGRERYIILSASGAAFFAQLVAGQPAAAPIFGKWWKESEQSRWMSLACERAGIERITFHGLRHTWASLSVMSGMPMPIVAKNLGHTSTKMCEQHYSHLEGGFITDQIRRFAPDFGKIETNVRVYPLISTAVS